MTTIEGRVRPIRIRKILAVLFFAVPALLSYGETIPDAAFPVIDSISFQVASPYMISYEEMIGLVTVRPGNLLTPVAIRESIRRLHRKSLFREITAYVREDGKRAQILFFLRPLPVVTQIEVSGQKQIARSQILAASRIRRGRPAESEDLLRAQDSILSVLKGKGFLDAAVSVKAVCSMNTGMAKVRIEVKEGSSAVVREVRVKGAEFFPRDSLEDLLGVTVGFCETNSRRRIRMRSPRPAICSFASFSLTASCVVNVKSFPFSTTPGTTTSRSTIASARAVG